MSTWPEIIREAIRQSLDQTHTMIPGEVVSYDSSKQLCTCKSTIKLDPEMPELLEVPVYVAGGSRAYIHFDLEVGDTGMIVFSERDFSDWYVRGKTSEPVMLKTHDLYAIFIPGVRVANKKLISPEEFPGVLIARMSNGATGPSGHTYVHLDEKVKVTSGPYVLTKPLCKSDKFILWASAIEAAIDGVAPGAGSACATLRNGIATEMLESE